MCIRDSPGGHPDVQHLAAGLGAQQFGQHARIQAHGRQGAFGKGLIGVVDEFADIAEQQVAGEGGGLLGLHVNQSYAP